MTHSTAELPALPPATDFEDIRRALADVDARLSAWAEAMTQAHVDLAERAAGAGPDAGPSVSPAPADSCEKQAEGVPAEPEPPAPDPAASQSPLAQSQSPVAEPVAPPSSVPDPAPPQPDVPPARPVEPNAEASAPSPAGRSASQEEDEALLASLDPETAKAIRVMRRLTFDRKSVRELIEEYRQTRNPSESAEHRKKSWWSRG